MTAESGMELLEGGEIAKRDPPLSGQFDDAPFGELVEGP
jgi:hypothetical protein